MVVIKTMKEMKKIIITGLLAVALVACTKESTTGPGAGGNEISLEITPTVAQTSQEEAIETRARVSGTSFSLGDRVGLFIAGSNVPASIYDNILALRGGAGWGYYLNGLYNGTVLSGFSDWNTITLHGYYPYDANVTNLNSIPFRIADETSPGSGEAVATEEEVSVDYMVAGTKTKDMSTSAPTDYLTLEFHHLMTAIDINLTKPYQGPNLLLDRAVLEIGAVGGGGGGTRSLSINGTYSANNSGIPNLSAELTATTSVKKLTMNYTSTNKIVSHNSNRRSPLLIMPELRHNVTPGLEDAEVTITLYFTETNGDPYVFEDIDSDGSGNPQIKFNLSDIANAADDDGLLAGKVYLINASVGTYVKFTGSFWIVSDPIEDDGEQKIEI